MEEPGEVHIEENSLPETNKKRRFKTPAQLQALEEFYNEHKYPTDSLKAEVAEKLGLTEKQISGWFCHRRLKDRRLQTEETRATVRQDLSSGVIQDRGSGLQQDSCGSTKRGDQKLADLKEVESRRFIDEDLPPAEIHHGQRGNNGTATSDMDDTSSESNSDLHDRFQPRGRNAMDMETVPYGTPSGFVPRSRGRVGPSGFLKIKGQIENVAITAVKRQLGRYYREDGPPLGVEFEPLPPEAFESPIRNTVHERSTPVSLDVRGACWPPSQRNDLSGDAAKSIPSHISYQDTTPPFRQPLKKPSNGNSVLNRKPSISTDEYSTVETPVYDGIMNSGIRPKHVVQGTKPSRFPGSHLQPSGGKITSEQIEPWLKNYDNMNPKAACKRASLVSNPSSLKSSHKNSHDKGELKLPSRITEPNDFKIHQHPVGSKHLVNDIKASKRERGFVQQDLAARPASEELPPLTKQIRGSAVEMPSSFSEDETAETSSSVD